MKEQKEEEKCKDPKDPSELMNKAYNKIAQDLYGDVYKGFSGIFRGLDINTASEDDLNRFMGYNQSPATKEHQHEWAVYNSGFSMYDYCKTCNKRREE